MDIPTLDEWGKTSSARRLEVGKTISARLGLRFEGLHTFALGAAPALEVARFGVERQRGTFSLVPGGEARLGFDPGRFKPSAEQKKEFKCLVADTDHHRLRLAEFLEQRLGPLRRATIEPLLVFDGFEPVEPDRPSQALLARQLEKDEAMRSVRRHFPPPEGTARLSHHLLPDASERALEPGAEEKLLEELEQLMDDDCFPPPPSEPGVRRLTRRFGPTGKFEEAWFAVRELELASRLQAAGFDLPGYDEWEYLCAAGSVTLFRWGDEVKASSSPHDAQRAGFDLHRRPNAFGLLFPATGGTGEVVKDSCFRRGGDASVLGNNFPGSFISWLPLATSFDGADFLAVARPDVITCRKVIRLARV
jgi:hypothetical protein